MASTAEAIAGFAQATPLATAVIQDGRQIKYGQLAGELAACVRLLRAIGVQPGMLVGVEMERNRYRSLLRLLACEVIGAATTAFLPPDLERTDLVLSRCDRLLFSSPPPPNCTAVALAVAPDVGTIPGPHATPGDMRLLARRPDPRELVRITRTSGSTGLPKALPITADLQQRIIAQRLRHLPAEIRSTLRMLCLYQWSLRGAYTRAYATLQAGGTLILSVREQALALLGAGVANWVILLVGDMAVVAAQVSSPPKGSALLVEAIGARVERGLRQLVRGRLGGMLHTSYSSNEVNVVAYTDDDNVGTLCAGAEARIVDEQGRPCPAGAHGLIRVKTTTMVDHYWNDPDQTTASFIDGWWQTNDVGYVPEPGRLVVLGRADDMLNVGGVKLPPGPIEDEIRRLPNVRDAALLSQSDDAASATLTVAIEMASPGPVDHLWRAVAPLVTRHVPRFDLLVFPSFPRTDSGKVRR